MEKQIIAKNKKSQKTPALESREDLDTKIEELKLFMDSFNPYLPITSSDQKVLNSYDIYDLGDPFKITNELIFLIEELIEKREKLK